MTPSIEVHIEELILQGFAPGDRYRVAEAVRRELGRRLTQESTPGLLTRSAEIESMDAGTVHITVGTRADAVGARVGEAVHFALRQPPSLRSTTDGRS